MRITYDDKIISKINEITSYRRILESGYVTLKDLKDVRDSNINLSVKETFYMLFAEWIKREFECDVRNNSSTISMNLSKSEIYHKFLLLKEYRQKKPISPNRMTPILNIERNISNAISSIAYLTKKRPSGFFIYFSKDYMILQTTFNQMFRIKTLLMDANRMYVEIMDSEKTKQENIVTSNKVMENTAINNEASEKEAQDIESRQPNIILNNTHTISHDIYVVNTDLQRRVDEAILRRRNT